MKPENRPGIVAEMLDWFGVDGDMQVLVTRADNGPPVPEALTLDGEPRPVTVGSVLVVNRFAVTIH